LGKKNQAVNIHKNIKKKLSRREVIRKKKKESRSRTGQGEKSKENAKPA
jgi:hypothetical protein